MSATNTLASDGLRPSSSRSPWRVVSSARGATAGMADGAGRPGPLPVLFAIGPPPIVTMEDILPRAPLDLLVLGPRHFVVGANIQLSLATCTKLWSNAKDN